LISFRGLPTGTPFLCIERSKGYPSFEASQNPSKRSQKRPFAK